MVVVMALKRKKKKNRQQKESAEGDAGVLGSPRGGVGDGHGSP